MTTTNSGLFLTPIDLRQPIPLQMMTAKATSIRGFAALNSLSMSIQVFDAGHI